MLHCVARVVEIRCAMSDSSSTTAILPDSVSYYFFFAMSVISSFALLVKGSRS